MTCHMKYINVFISGLSFTSGSNVSKTSQTDNGERVWLAAARPPPPTTAQSSSIS